MVSELGLRLDLVLQLNFDFLIILFLPLCFWFSFLYFLHFFSGLEFTGTTYQETVATSEQAAASASRRPAIRCRATTVKGSKVSPQRQKVQLCLLLTCFKHQKAATLIKASESITARILWFISRIYEFVSNPKYNDSYLCHESHFPMNLKI